MAADGAKSALTSPPAGTGYVSGLGEAFKINFSTGQGVYTYKLALPDGVAGHTPTLSLEYAHGAGHGPFGQGWRLPVRRISLRLDYGVPDDGPTEHYADSGAEIVPLTAGGFGALVESAFARYSRLGDGWQIEERNGTVHELGTTASARVADPAHPDRPHEWLLERSLDPSGNAIDYRYRIDQGMPYLEEVRYAAYSVRFRYESRPDVRLDGRAGYLRQRALRCTHIVVALDPGPGERLIRSWTLGYTQAPGSNVSLLSSIQMTSHGEAADGSQDVARTPATFDYTSACQVSEDLTALTMDHTLTYMDAPEGSHPPALTDDDTALVVLDDAPLPGVIQNVNGRQYYWPNLGDGTWGVPRPVKRAPGVNSYSLAGLAFVDMDASGAADLLVATGYGPPGYYENAGREGFERFVAFPRGRRAAPFWFSDQVRLSDADGNGRIDAMMSHGRSFAVWLNQGRQGWDRPLLAPKGTGADRPDVDLGDPLAFLADMNGDGLDDLVRVRSGRVEYWPGLGRGRFGTRVVMDDSPRLRDLYSVAGRPSQPPFLLDVDGDGCADLVRLTADGVEVHLNQNGQAFAEPILLGGVPAAIPGTVRPASMAGRTSGGLVWNSYRGRRTTYTALEFGSGQPGYLLTRIDNGAGLVSEILYRSAVEDFRRDQQAGGRWTTHMPFPYLVVAGLREVDQVSGHRIENSYRYHEGHYEADRRQFQGFRRTEQLETGDDSRPDTLTVFHFLMGQERLPGRGPEHAALNGMLHRTEVYGLDGSANEDRPYRVEESDYDLQVLETAPDGRSRTFVFVQRHRVEDRDRGDDVRGEEKTYTYDAFGNVTREELRGYGERGGISQAERRRLTEATYIQAAGRYRVDQPADIVVRDGAGTILSETRRYYDGADFVGLPLGQATRGLEVREEHLVLSQAEFNAHYGGMDAGALGYTFGTDADGQPAVFANGERHAYNARGVKTADMDGAGNQTSYVYDANGLFRTSLTTSMGTTQLEYDRALGQPTRVTYPDGKEVHYDYDAQGRVLAAALPGESLINPPSTYSYDDSAIPNARIGRFRPTEDPADEVLAVTYFDGRGKEFQQRLQLSAGQFVVSGLRQINPWGDLEAEYQPTFAASSAFALPDTTGQPSRQVRYDALGRVVRSENYNGGVSTAEYQPFQVTTRDANDNDASPENVARGQFNTPHREEFDVLRYLTAVEEELGGGQTRRVTYQTGVTGDLLGISDDQGNLATYVYDQRGSRLRIQHREAGERRMWYDARRLVVRTLDPEGNDLQAEIDARNRLHRLRHNGAVIEEYTYDDVARNALGRLAEVSYRGGRQVFDYDLSGRLAQHSYHFDGLATPQTLNYSYDRLGREIGVRHTDGTTLTRELTGNGWVRAIPGILDRVDYDARGLPTRIDYANGVVSQTSYTPGPGRVQTQATTGPGGQVLQQITYSYDQMEILLSSDDVAPGGAGLRTYTYDPLYQITSATAMEAGAPVTRQYDYANIMNLSRFDEADVTMHYDDPLHPDRLAGLTPSGGARLDTSFDSNGNLLDLPGKTFAYNAKNELDRFTAANGLTADYRYDHQGLRVSKTITEPGGAVTRTFFVGDVAEIRNGQTTLFVRLGPVRVAVISSGQTRFVHPDPMGSTSLFSDATGTPLASIAYHPFGNVAASSGAADPRTFGVHPFDAESGLYYMRRRYYAPEIGRFLTPDPLAIYQPTEYVHRPASLHVFAFVANDPLNKTDLAGLSFWSVFGAIIGVIVAIAVVALTIMTGGVFGVLLGIALAIAIVAVAYVVASATAGTDFGEFMRGFLIGFNAGMNAVLASMVFGPVIGVALGVINFLAAFDTIANNSVYQGILGWTSWLMPMSWLATAVGLIFFVLNVIPAIFTGNQVEAVRIHSLSIDWGTGTIVMEGGWLFLPGFQGGYNLGNFAYITPGSTVTDHETGHTLNVAAFGSIFHFIGAIDENAVQSTPANAYAERLADSHDPNGPTERALQGEDPIIPMWV